MITTPAVDLSDGQLVQEVKRLVPCERGAIAQLIVHLAEMDGRTIHLAAGFPSLYTCVEELQLSEYEAHHRIEVARAGKAFPRIFRMLGDGTLSMTTAQLLARQLTPGNQEALLSGAAGRSKREVQELLARHFPRPDAPDTVRKLPQPKPTAAAAVDEAPPVVVSSVGGVDPCPVPSTHRPVVTPLAPDRYRVTFTADAETCEMLALAKDLLRHAVPSGDTAEVIKRALRTLLKDVGRKKFAATDKPRMSGEDGTAAATRSGPSRATPALWNTTQADGWDRSRSG